MRIGRRKLRKFALENRKTFLAYQVFFMSKSTPRTQIRNVKSIQLYNFSTFAKNTFEKNTHLETHLIFAFLIEPSYDAGSVMTKYKLF